MNIIKKLKQELMKKWKAFIRNFKQKLITRYKYVNPNNQIQVFENVLELNKPGKKTTTRQLNIRVCKSWFACWNFKQLRRFGRLIFP